MKKELFKITTIGLAKESESPENPKGLEKRVALIPEHIKALVECGCKVFVEFGAGERMGYSDSEYQLAGATLQQQEEIYSDKDMIIKFKGPSLENISRMKPKTILFCMAHFRSFKERADLLQKNRINVIAMEEILESPNLIPNEIVMSKRFIEETLKNQDIANEELHIGFLGYSENMIGGIRRAGNRQPQTLTVYQEDIQLKELNNFGRTRLYFYDSRIFKNYELISKLKSLSCQVYDFKIFEETGGASAVEEYYRTHPPFKFGKRRIQCLHETGMAGARYGFSLLTQTVMKGKENSKRMIRASVLGYGNVGMGAIHECYEQGVRAIQVLGRRQTNPKCIELFLKNSDLIVNGAEQAAELRGKNYLIKSDYIGTIIQRGSVVIDLVGGSASNRSPVEDIIECTYLTNPHFEKNGVIFSALWGWPMMGMVNESVLKYSGQILDVLLGKESLLKGLDHLTLGVERALVCGPFVNKSV